MAVISMKTLLETGAHFGHQTKRWNNKMSPYIYGVKSGIHIIDLKETLHHLKDAYEYVRNASAQGQSILFVATKPQMQGIVQEEAERCGGFYINHRWLGGMLTNYNTVKQSLSKLKAYEEMAGQDNEYEGLIKKEALKIQRKREKLDRSLGGVRNMKKVASIIFIVDTKNEHLAVKEARKLGIPIVAITDTNCDPTLVEHAIPANDDSQRTVRLITNVISSAVLEGKALRAKGRKDDLMKKKHATEETKAVPEASEEKASKSE